MPCALAISAAGSGAHGRGYWRDRIGDAQFSTQAPSFFQVNTAQAAKLVDKVMEGLGGVDGKFVADLYAGGGTFSIPLAMAGADVVAVESAGSSVRDLRFNADANGVYVDVVGGDAARELRELGQLDALVVDPPRAGLADSAARATSQRLRPRPSRMSAATRPHGRAMWGVSWSRAMTCSLRLRLTCSPRHTT